MRYIILTWMSMDLEDINVMTDIDIKDEIIVAVFDTHKEAEDYAEDNCAFNYKIVCIDEDLK